MTECARPEENGLPPELAELADDFELLGEIGRGATAVVYRARERALDRTVAIKVIRARHIGDDEAVQRLEREARLVARLNHPNVVTLYAVRRLRHGSLALVMRYVEGESLRTSLRRHGALPAARVRRLAADVARALAAAHAHGVVHRDVKPDNVYVAYPSGRAELADFGAAVPLDAASRLTATGTTIGTPGYLAPELVDGAPATPQSDLYGLGLVAWEALTGMQPWGGETLFEVLAFRKHGTLPSLESLVPDVPSGLVLAIERALLPDPAQRWPSAAAMLTALIAPDQARRGLRARLSGWRSALSPGPMVAVPPPLPAPRAATADQPTVVIRRPAPVPPPPFAPRPSSGEVPTDAPGAAAAAAAAPGALPAEPAGGEPGGAPDLAAIDAPAAEAADGTAAGVETPAARRARRPGDAVVLTAVLAAAAALVFLVGGDEPRAEDREPVAVSAEADAPERFAVDVERGDVSAAPPASGDPVVPVDPLAPLPPASGDPAPIPAPPVGPASSEASAASPATDDAAVTPPTVPPPPIPAPAPPSVVVPPPTPSAPTPSAPAPAAAARRASFVSRSVAVGGLHSCSVNEDGALFCWGGNERGQLGSRGGRALVADLIDEPRSVRRLALGLLHSCAITTAGVVVCWGGNDRGQLGDGTRTPRAASDAVPGVADAADLAVGAAHSCALLRAGRVVCWGANDDGQLGIGHRVDREAPAFVAGDLRVARIVAGWNHTCALERDGRALCWGRGVNGELGDGRTDSRPHPVRVAGEHRFRELAAGRAHSCGVSTSGAVLCWGDNSAGQAGARGRGEFERPTTVPGVNDARLVVAGSLHSCALTARGETYCWGQNRYGQLGDGSTAEREAPVRVVGAPAFVDLAASGAHTCGVTRGGETWCWGYNLEGQLGDGSRQNRPRPVRVRARAD